MSKNTQEPAGAKSGVSVSDMARTVGLTAHSRRRTTGIGVRETVPDLSCGSGRPTGSEFPPSPTSVSRERPQVVRTRHAGRIPFRRPAAGAKFVPAGPNLPVAGVR
jgi:hypothetical protein